MHFKNRINLKRTAYQRLGSLALVFAMVFTNIAAPLVQVNASIQETKIEAEETIQDGVLDGISLTESDGLKLVDELDPASHDPARHATETDAGDDEENEVEVPSSDSINHETDTDSEDESVDDKDLEATDLTNLDEFVLDPIIESHIVNNYDDSLVAYDSDEMSLIGVLPVRSTIFDDAALGNYRTLASVATNDDVWFESFLSMFVTTVPLYELSQDSDYFVAFTDTLFNDHDVNVLDYVFAVSNLYGEVVQARFDVETGIAYIPRELLIEEATDTLHIGEIQLQLMQGIRSNDADIDSAVETLVETELTEGTSTFDEFVHDVIIAPANAFETTVEIDAGLKANDITVFVNGFEFSNFDYDAQTGEVTVPHDSASIISLRVEVLEEDTQIDPEVAAILSSFEFQTIQPQASNVSLGDVTLNSNFDSAGVMTFNTPFRYFHYGNNPWNNYGHMAWYGPDQTHAESLINQILNGGVDFGNLEVSSLGADLMPLVLNIGSSSDSPFESISNVDSRFAGNRFNGPGGRHDLSILLACATVNVPVLDSMGSTTTITPGVESRGHVGVRARIVRRESDKVYIGFVTGNTYGGASGQAGYGVLAFNLEKDPTGSMGIQKRSAGDSAYVNDNPLYSLQGARYGVWSTQGDAVSMDSNTRLWTMTTNSSGWAQKDDVELGTYFVREITPSVGHTLDPNIYRVSINVNNHETRQVVTSNQPVPSDPPMLRLQKIDADGTPNAQGGGTLGGARYTVRYFAGTNTSGSPVRTWVYETNDQGLIWFEDDLFLVTSLSDAVWKDTFGNITFPLGTITVQETRAPVGYLIDPTVFVGHIEQHPTNHAQATFRWANGTNGSLMAYNATDGMTHNEQAIRGGVRIEKWDIENQATRPQGDATLKGTEYAVYNRSENPVIVDGVLRQRGEQVGTLTTNAQGVATSSAEWLPYGTFEAVEVNPPNGYLNTGVVRRTFNIRENGVVVNLNTANTSIQNNVIRGGVEVEKLDRELSIWQRIGDWIGLKPVQGDGSLEDIEFTITNVSNPADHGDGAVLVNGSEGHRLFEVGEIVHVMHTKYERNGDKLSAIARTPHDLLPHGTYRVQETATNDSYLLTDGEARYFQIRVDGEIVALTVDGEKLVFENNVARGDVLIEKFDFELQASEAMGGTSLNDIEFDLFNESAEPILYFENGDTTVAPRAVEPGELVTTINLFWDEAEGAYLARTFDRALPFGTYRIVEARRNNYYLLPHPETGLVFEAIFQIREDGELVRNPIWTNLPNDDGVMRATNQTIRNDIQFNKIAEETNQRLSYVPFLVTNRATGEAHVIITDKNGMFRSDSSWFEPGFRTPETTNQNDHLLDYVERDEIIPISSMEKYTQVWFGAGEFGTGAPIHPTWGAFPYGWYDMIELKSESNQNYEMLEVEFYVSRHITHNREIDLGTLTNHNRPVEPELEASISTQAHIGDGETQTFTHGESLYLYDTVEVEVCDAFGETLRFRAELIAEDANGDRDIIYVSDYVYFTVDEEGCITREFEIKTTQPIDTSLFDLDGRFFWSEVLFLENEVIDEDTDEYELVYEEIYHHNPDGEDPDQDLHPVEPEPTPEPTPELKASISTQAHIGDGETQTFTHGESLYLYDTVEVEVCDAFGETLRFRAELIAEDANGDRDIIYVSDYVYFTVDEEGCITPEFEIKTTEPIDTSLFDLDGRFFWSEVLFLENEVIDEDTDEYELVYEEIYHHNPDGEDPDQDLHPVEPESTLEPTPKLPATGFVNSSHSFIAGVVTLLAGAGFTIYRKRAKAINKNESFKKK